MRTTLLRRHTHMERLMRRMSPVQCAVPRCLRKTYDKRWCWSHRKDQTLKLPPGPYFLPGPFHP
jgi:hypothetical protein